MKGFDLKYEQLRAWQIQADMNLIDDLFICLHFVNRETTPIRDKIDVEVFMDILACLF